SAFEPLECTLSYRCTELVCTDISTSLSKIAPPATLPEAYAPEHSLWPLPSCAACPGRAGPLSAKRRGALVGRLNRAGRAGGPWARRGRWGVTLGAPKGAASKSRLGGFPPQPLARSRIGKTKGIFVRVPRKRAPCSDFHAVLDLFVSETSLIASCHEHHR